MEQALGKKLLSFLATHHPDVLLEQGQHIGSYITAQVASVTAMAEQLFAEQQPAYLVEEVCLQQLTAAYGPSRYLYLLSILEEEFTEVFSKWSSIGILPYEVINLQATCKEIFDKQGFSEASEGDRLLRYAVMGRIREYLDGIA
jgi:hypothetical protein